MSHSLGVVRNLCDRVVLLDGGRVVAEGAADEVSDAYLKLVHQQSDRGLKRARERSERSEVARWGSGKVEVRRVRCLDAGGEERYTFTPGECLTIEASYRVRDDVSRPVFGVGVYRSDGTYICGVNHLWHEEPVEVDSLQAGETGRVRCTIEPLPLLQGTYYISYYCYDHSETVPTALDHLERVTMFQVTEGDLEIHGTVVLPTRWEVTR